jgi:hydrogenase expression/formation protein HypD
MHELSLCQAIAGVVRTYADGRQIDVVRVRIGALRQVVPESLSFCWGLVRDYENMPHAELELECVTAEVACRSCGRRSEITSAWSIWCPRCDSPDVEVLSGDEFPLDALKIAIDNPDKEVVFFAIGFETTAPSTAVTLVRARDLGLPNFSVFCNHVTIVPPIKAILESPDLRLSGFIGPGHVSTVVGNRPYRFVPEVYRKPLVVAGFEPLDILASVAMLLRQIREGRCEVENQYKRVVPEHGNPAALALMGKVFALRPHFEWRGLGFISQSALRLHE